MKKKIKPFIRTDYLSRVYHPDQFQKTIDKLVKKVSEFKRKIPFEAIAFTGTSGAAVAYAVSYKLKIPLICLRKRRDASHYYGLVEGAVAVESYIIIDDFIASGKTINKIISTLSKEGKKYKQNNKAVGIILYDDGNSVIRKWGNIPIVRIR